MYIYVYIYVHMYKYVDTHSQKFARRSFYSVYYNITPFTIILLQELNFENLHLHTRQL